MRHVAANSFEHRRLQRRRPVLIQQTQQLGGDTAQAVAARGRQLQQRGARRRDLSQGVAAAVGARTALVFDQGLQMLRVFDHLVAIKAARVASEFGDAVEDTDLLLVGQDRQRTSHVGVRHRVVIEVESQWATKGPLRVPGRLGHRDLQALTQGIRGGGQLEQAGLFEGEGLAYGQRVVLGPGAVEGAAPAPGNGLRVEIVDIGELARGEEALADEVNMAFDPALLIAAADRHRARLEAVVGSEAEELRVEANRVAHAFEHDALEVVVQQGSCESAECTECLDVTTLGKLSI